MPINDILLDKGGAVFNVKSFGALGDDHAPENQWFEAAQNEALASLGKGGMLYVPQGTYQLDHFVLRVSMLLAPGAVLVPKTGDLSSALGILYVLKADGIFIRGGTIDGKNRCKVVVVQSGYNVTISDVHVKGGGDTGIAFYDSNDCTVSNCIIEDCMGKSADGIYFGGCFGTSALYNKIKNVCRAGICSEGSSRESYNTKIIGNSIGGQFYPQPAGSREFHAGIWVEHSVDVLIRDNTITLEKKQADDKEMNGINIRENSKRPHKVDIADNHILDSKIDTGIDIQDSNAIVSIRGGIMQGNIGNGIRIKRAVSVNVRDLSFYCDRVNSFNAVRFELNAINVKSVILDGIVSVFSPGVINLADYVADGVPGSGANEPTISMRGIKGRLKHDKKDNIWKRASVADDCHLEY